MTREATVAGSDTGGFMGLPPTGKPFRLLMLALFTLRGAEIVRERRITIPRECSSRSAS